MAPFVKLKRPRKKKKVCIGGALSSLQGPLFSFLVWPALSFSQMHIFKLHAAFSIKMREGNICTNSSATQMRFLKHLPPSCLDSIETV